MLQFGFKFWKLYPDCESATMQERVKCFKILLNQGLVLINKKITQLCRAQPRKDMVANAY